MHLQQMTFDNIMTKGEIAQTIEIENIGKQEIKGLFWDENFSNEQFLLLPQCFQLFFSKKTFISRDCSDIE